MHFRLNEKRNEISFSFDTRVYRKEALYGAALVFTGQAYVYMTHAGRETLSVSLQSKIPASAGKLQGLAGEFHNELLNQTLRWMVSQHNKVAKNAIITQALYAAHVRPGKKKK